MPTLEAFKGANKAPTTLRIELQSAYYSPAFGLEPQAIVWPLSLEIRSSEFLSIIGPPGCGKTTLLRLIAGTLPLTDGKILIRGSDILPPSRNFGMVLSIPALLPWRTAIQNILLQAEIRNLNPQECRNRARRLLAWFGLSKFEDSRPHQLPAGGAQAVSICRALLHSPPLLLMDDPFASLDPLAAERVLDGLMCLLPEMQTSSLLCTGSMHDAVLLSDRVAVMSRRPGRILETIAVDMPRPRRLDGSLTPQFADCCNRIRTLFRAQGILP